MAVTTEGTPNPTRLSNIHQRDTQAVVITVMTKCETLQIHLPQTRCEDQTALKNMLTVLDMGRPRVCTFTGSEREMGGPAFLHKKIPITTVLFIAQIHILLLQARHLILLMSQQMTGQSISVPRAKNTIITAEQKYPSGRNRKSGWKGNNARRSPVKWQLIVSPKTETTEEKPCKPQLRWMRNIPMTPAACFHRTFCLRQAGTMTETTDCPEQRLTAVQPQCSTLLNLWFTRLLPQAVFPLVLLQYSLITLLQRSHLMQMEHQH